MNESLTFEALELQLCANAPKDSVDRVDRLAYWMLRFALAGAVLALLSPYVLPEKLRLPTMLIGLVLEVGAGVVYLIIECRKLLPSFRNAKSDLSKDLDRQYTGYLSVIVWLRKFPLAEVRQKLEYLKHRQETLTRRLGLLTGSIERLGVLPIAAAIYVQLKGAGWPPQIGLWQGLLALALVTFYALGFWFASLKLRIDLYVSVLSAALDTKRA